MFTTKIIFISRQFLDLNPLKLAIITWKFRLILDQFTNQINSIPVLNTDKWPIHTFTEQCTCRLHISGSHLTFQPFEVLLTPIHGIVDNKLDKSFRLTYKLIQRNECTLIFNMQELCQMLGRIRLLGPKTLLTGVHLTKTTYGSLQWQLTTHSQPDLERISLGIIGKHKRTNSKCFPRPLTITNSHNVRICQLYILLIHKQMYCHIQFRSDTENTLTSLGAESIEWQVTQTSHFLFSPLL